jgi:hypothetical protein
MKSLLLALAFSVVPFSLARAKDVIVVSIHGSSSSSVNIHSAVRNVLATAGYTLHEGENWTKTDGPGIISDSETEDLRDIIDSLATRNGGDKSNLALLVVGKSAGGVLAWNTFRLYFDEIDEFYRIALVMVDPHGSVNGDGVGGSYRDRQDLWWPGDWSSNIDHLRVYNIYQHQRSVSTDSGRLINLTGASFPDHRVYENIQLSTLGVNHSNIPDQPRTHELIREAFEFARGPRGYWGNLGDLPVAGDFDDDRGTDKAVFRPSNRMWYFDYDSDNSTDARLGPWAVAGDLPIAGDFDRDGIRDDIAVFRPSNRVWYYDFDCNGSTDDRRGPWGIQGDLPISGDFDRDGRCDDVGVFRSSNRTWRYDFDHDGTTDEISGPWAVDGDLPIAGDFDGDGQCDDVGVYRASNSTKYVDLDHNGSTDGSGPSGLSVQTCHPVVVSKPSGDEIWLFCGGIWWAKSPDSPY